MWALHETRFSTKCIGQREQIKTHMRFIFLHKMKHILWQNMFYFTFQTWRIVKLFSAEVYWELTFVSYKKIQLPPGSRRIKICEKCPVLKASTKRKCVVQWRTSFTTCIPIVMWYVCANNSSFEFLSLRLNLARNLSQSKSTPIHPGQARLPAISSTADHPWDLTNRIQP